MDPHVVYAWTGQRMAFVPFDCKIIIIQKRTDGEDIISLHKALERVLARLDVEVNPRCGSSRADQRRREESEHAVFGQGANCWRGFSCAQKLEPLACTCAMFKRYQNSLRHVAHAHCYFILVSAPVMMCRV